MHKNISSKNIFPGYILCESTSQLNASKMFSPGVCRGDSQAWLNHLQI
jgi:hypothetical protein